jgi:hypothetical protein
MEVLVSHNQENRNEAANATLIDLIIVLVICTAITIFVCWIATRLTGALLFEQLPAWVTGTYGFLSAILTGTVGIGAAVLESIRRKGPKPDYLKLVAVCQLAIIAMIAAVVWIVKPPVPLPPIPTPAPTAGCVPSVKVFTHPDVTRNGKMLNIRATLIDNSSCQNKDSTMLIEYYWTGSGGTQGGSQTATVRFLSAEGATLQSEDIGIKRDHCYYAGGIYQKKEGVFRTSPALVNRIEAILSEVNGGQGGC